MGETPETPETIVQPFIDRFESAEYQKPLTALEQAFANFPSDSVEDWSHDVYIRLRDDPTDPLANTLNSNRKECLKLVYDLVNELDDEYGEDENLPEWTEAITNGFGAARLTRILMIGLPMDRAQSLYRMKVPEPSGLVYGMHWYCKLHLAKDTAYARTFAEEQKAWMEETVATYEGRPTMNKRLFRLLFLPALGLQKVELLSKWSRPTAATIVRLPVSTGG